MNTAPGNPDSSLSASDTIPTPEAGKEERGLPGPPPEMNWWNKAKPFVELAGVILLGLYTAYTIKMYHANKEAADAATRAADIAHASLILAQQSFKVQQRPYLWVKTPTVTHGGAVAGKPVLMNVDFSNAGLTPAIHLSSHLYIKFSQITDADFDEIKGKFKRPDNEAGGIVTQNNPMFGTAVSIRDLAPGTLEVIPWNGRDPIYVFGRLEYDDVFGDSHWTEFCWNYLLPNQVFMSCPAHNGIDLPKLGFTQPN